MLLPLRGDEVCIDSRLWQGRLMAATRTELFHVHLTQPKKKEKKKTKSGNRLPSNTKQIMPLSAGEIWQLSLIHDTFWHRNVYIPRGRREGRNVSMRKIWCKLQASPSARGATFTCSTYQKKMSFFSKTSASSLQLVKLENLSFGGMAAFWGGKMLLFCNPWN